MVTSTKRIDGATNLVTDAVAGGTLPRGIRTNPATAQVYVTNHNSDDVSVIAEPPPDCTITLELSYDSLNTILSINVTGGTEAPATVDT